MSQEVTFKVNNNSSSSLLTDLEPLEGPWKRFVAPQPEEFSSQLKGEQKKRMSHVGAQGRGRGLPARQSDWLTPLHSHTDNDL